MTEPVGFTAMTTDTLTYNEDDVIEFPLAMSNFGGYYNPASGLFTCPYDGIYMFFNSIRSDSSDVDCYMHRESSILLHMFSLRDASRSNLVITRCNRGERVWARQQYDNYVIEGSHSTMFSGFLLYKY